MDERLRHLERATRTGDPEATSRLLTALRRSGRPAAAIPLEERARLGLFDTFTTRLRDDIVAEAQRTAEEGQRFSEEVNLEPAWWPVDLLVNGEPLGRLVDGSLDSRLPAHSVYLPTRHLLGEPYEWPTGWSMRDEDGKTLLHYCCGWCDQRIVAAITVSGETVTWSGFEGRPNPRPVEGLAYVFRRAEYEAALRDPPP